MEKLSRKYIFLLIFLPLVVNECSFDQEYYIKAIKMLNEERTIFGNEIKKEISSLFSIIEVHQLNIDFLVQEIKNMKTQLLENDKEINKIKSENSLLKTDIIKIKSDLDEIKNDSVSKSTKSFNMYSHEVIVYRDIFEALKKNVIKKFGNPDYWDETTYSRLEWNKRKMLRIGSGLQNNLEGLQVNVVDGYDIIWICHLSDRRMAIRVESKEYPDDIQLSNGFGKHNLNEVYPDGSMSDSGWSVHKWMPLVLYRTGIHYLHCDYVGLECWLSGIAFGKNIWNHTKSYSPSFFYKLNGGDSVVDDGVWKNDELARVEIDTSVTINVPIIPNGKDKLMYFVSHNDNWNETVGSVMVNYKSIERLKSTYVNPFSIHTNSKIYQRYYASKIPKDYYGENDRFVKITIETNALKSEHFYFRAIGIHDYY